MGFRVQNFSTLGCGIWVFGAGGCSVFVFGARGIRIGLGPRHEKFHMLV